jgi:hypothetical protein
MKFWLLVSVLRSESAGLRRVLSDAKWREYADWHAHLDEYVRIQDRSVLDAAVPDELCRAALALSPTKYELTEGRLTAIGSSGAGTRSALSALDVYNSFGGEILEDVAEYGSAQAVRRP